MRARLILPMLLAACGTATATPPRNPPQTSAVAWPPARGTPGGLPDDRRPLPEMGRTADSPQGAAAVLERYATAVSGGHWTAGHDAWGDAGQALAFERRWRDAREVHALIGRPGEPDGGCGSIYVTVPVQFYGTLNSGGRLNEIGTATLRRVNGVDGATPRQLAWHIDRIDLRRTAG